MLAQLVTIFHQLSFRVKPDADVWPDVIDASELACRQPSSFRRKFGKSDILKSGYPEIRKIGYPEIRISGNPEIPISGYPMFRISGYTDIRICGFSDMRFADFRISGHPAFRIHGNPDIPIKVTSTHNPAEALMASCHIVFGSCMMEVVLPKAVHSEQENSKSETIYKKYVRMKQIQRHTEAA